MVRRAFRNRRPSPARAFAHAPQFCEPLEGRRMLSISTVGIPTWVDQGPRPIADAQVTVPPDDFATGAVESVAVNPSNPQQIYVGTVNGGVWRTNNADPTNPDATTWTPLTDRLSTLSMGDIAFSPLDATGNTLFAGTGSFSSLGQSGGPAVGVVRTTDGGQNWSTFPLPGGQNVIRTVLPTSVDLDPTAGVQQMVLVGTVGGGGLYRSSNNGQTYTLLSGANGLPNGDCVRVVADPNDPNRFYAGVTNQGVFRGDFNSGTGVITWTDLNDDGMAGETTAGSVELAVHDDGANTVVFALVSGPTQGAFRSTNAGDNWTALAMPPVMFQRDVTFRAANVMVADPTDDEVVYITSYGGGDDIYRYDPTGAGSWVLIDHAGASGNTAPHADGRDLTFIGNDILVDTNDGGIYFIQNPLNASANAWHSFIGGGGNGLGDVEVHNTAWDDRFNVAVAGMQDNGTQVQDGSGNRVWDHFSGGDGGDVAVDTTTLAGASQSIRYYSIQNLGSFSRAIVDSATNIVSTMGLLPGGGLAGFLGQFISPFEVNAIAATAAGESKRLVIGGGTDGATPVGAVYESNNAGTAATTGDVTWTQVPSNATTGSVGAMAYGGRRLGVDNPDALYVAYGSRVFVRTTAGGTLTATGTVFPGGGVTDIELDPADWQHAFVSDSNSVYETTDAGANWTNRTGDLVNSQIRTVEFFDGATDVVVAGGQGGVFRMISDDPGHWTEFGDLPNAVVFDLEYNATDDLLLAGTFGRGAWTVPGASAILPVTATIRIDGTGGDDTIRIIRDAFNPLVVNIFLNNATSTPDYSISLSAVEEIEVNGLAGHDTLIVDSSNGLITVPSGIIYDGGTDADELQLVQTGGAAQASDVYSVGPGPGQGSSVITGAGGTQTVEFDNLEPVLDLVPSAALTINATGAGNGVNFANGSIAGTALVTIDAFESIQFSNKTAVTVNGLAGADTFNLTATSTPTGLASLTINGGAEADTFNVATTLPASGTILNGGTAGDVVNLTATAAGSSLVVNGNDGNDRVTVTGAGLATGSTVNLSGDAGDDTFDITSSPVVAIPVHGGADSDTLKVNGQTLDYDMTNANFTTLGRQAITFDTTELLDVRNGTFEAVGAVGPNVRVQGVEDGPATLTGVGVIAGTLTADSAGTVSPAVGAGVAGTLSAGSTTLNALSTFAVDLNGMAVADHDMLNVSGTVTINGANLTGTVGFGTIPGDELVIIRNDLVDPVVGQFAQGFMVTIGGVKFTIDYAFAADPDGVGNDVALIRYGAELAPDPCGPSKMALFVSATSIADTVTVLPVTGNSRLRVVIQNASFTDNFGPFDFKGQIIVMGQNGNDVLSTEQVPSRDVMIYGNAGNDMLRTGNNKGILLGNAGNDILVGGNARDLLIGGVGADNLTGDNAGDILIAASTKYDVTGIDALANRQALCDIMHTWQHGGRMSSLLNAATVNDDAEVDIVNGGNGTDWFIVDLNDILDRARNEVASDL